MEFLAITLKREQGNGKGKKHAKNHNLSLLDCAPLKQKSAWLQDCSPLWLYARYGDGIFSFPHNLRSLTNKNPLESLFSNRPKKSIEFSPSEKEKEVLSYPDFFSFIVPDL